MITFLMKKTKLLNISVIYGTIWPFIHYKHSTANSWNGEHGKMKMIPDLGILLKFPEAVLMGDHNSLVPILSSQTGDFWK